MNASAPYPAFSESEMARRLAAVRERMRRDALECVIVYGAGRSTDVAYLTTWPGTREAFVVVPLEGEPTLLVQFANHLPNALRTATLGDVRWAGAESAEGVAAVLRENGMAGGRIGLAGNLPWRIQQRLAAALPEVEWVDATPHVRDVRLVKSAEEIERLRTACRLTDLAMAALERDVRPGLREDELPAIVEGAYLGHGATNAIHFMAATPMRDPRIGVPSQLQAHRVIERGDVLITEIGAEYWGYAGQIHRAYAVGEPPTAEYARLHDVAVEAYAAIAAVLRDGATAGDVVAAADVIHERGLTVYDDLFHGTDQLPPVLRTSRTLHRPVPDFTFREGMAVVIQPNVVRDDGRAGVQVGETVLVTRNGIERLHAYPMRFVRVA